MKPDLSRRVAAEFLGTLFLVAAVAGSGIMAERLSGGNVALALLANTIATGAALVALILAFGPISGAHLNPVVSLTDALEGGLTWPQAGMYAIVQIAGGVLGTIRAHAMFRLPVISLSHHVRSGWAQMLSEFVAAFGLLCVIWGCCAAEQPRLHSRLAHILRLPTGSLHPHHLLIRQSRLLDR